MLNPILLAALAARTITPLPANPAADYVFTVPVRIENMTHITSAWVACGISHRAPSGARYDVGTPGTGRTDIALSDGSFTGNITATVTANPTQLAQGYTPNGWQCEVNYRFRLPDGTVISPSGTAADKAAAYTRSTGQEITTRLTEVSGTIP